MIEASRRAKASRAKGIRFERSIARKLRAAGFVVQRILEYDGFGTGCDLRIGRYAAEGGRFADGGTPNEKFEWLPVALQCKAVNNPHAWKAGLAEAKKAMPAADIHACIHSYRRAIRVYTFVERERNVGPMNWKCFIDILRRNFLDFLSKSGTLHN